MKLTMKEARALREALVNAASKLDDKTAAKMPMLFEPMRYDDGRIVTGTKINWGNKLKRAKLDITDMEINNPDNAPELWEDINE